MRNQVSRTNLAPYITILLFVFLAAASFFVPWGSLFPVDVLPADVVEVPVVAQEEPSVFVPRAQTTETPTQEPTSSPIVTATLEPESALVATSATNPLDELVIPEAFNYPLPTSFVPADAYPLPSSFAVASEKVYSSLDSTVLVTDYIAGLFYDQVRSGPNEPVYNEPSEFLRAYTRGELSQYLTAYMAAIFSDGTEFDPGDGDGVWCARCLEFGEDFEDAVFIDLDDMILFKADPTKTCLAIEMALLEGYYAHLETFTPEDPDALPYPYNASDWTSVSSLEEAVEKASEDLGNPLDFPHCPNFNSGNSTDYLVLIRQVEEDFQVK